MGWIGFGFLKNTRIKPNFMPGKTTRTEKIDRRDRDIHHPKCIGDEADRKYFYPPLPKIYISRAWIFKRS
jgi:hypothetical protein